MFVIGLVHENWMLEIYVPRTFKHAVSLLKKTYNINEQVGPVDFVDEFTNRFSVGFQSEPCHSTQRILPTQCMNNITASSWPMPVHINAVYCQIGQRARESEFIILIFCFGRMTSTEAERGTI